MLKSGNPSPFKRTFITGLVVFTPLAVATWFIWFAVSQISDIVSPLLREGMRLSHLDTLLPDKVISILNPILSIIFMGGVIYGLGLLTSNVLGRQLFKSLENTFMRIPVVRSIYGSTRQFLQTFSQGDNQAFRKVVFFQYPREGLWTLGLLTGDARGEIKAQRPEHLVSVFVPTTPNPTSGWLIFVPQTDVTELDMSVEDAFKLIISGGVLIPERAPPKKP